MTQHNLRELARQGDPNAIATVINRSLQARGMNAQVIRDGGSLVVMLESDQVPPQIALVDFIRNGMTQLGVESIHTVKVYGRQKGEDEPAWEDEIELMPADPMFDLDEGAMSKEKPVDEEFDREGEDYGEPEGDYEEAEEDEVEDEEDEDEEDEDPPPQKRKIPLLAIVLVSILVPAAALAGLFFTNHLPFFTSSNSEPETSTPPPKPASPAPAVPQGATKAPSGQTQPASPASPVSQAKPQGQALTPPPTPPVASASPKPASPTPAPTASASPPAATPAPAKPASPAPKKAAAPLPQPDPWREAVSKAQTAANLTQTAQSPEEWDKVATLWQQAIALMKKVPQSSPNYPVATKKAVEYQTNLNYAKQNAGNL